jgi:hypothetical protein
MLKCIGQCALTNAFADSGADTKPRPLKVEQQGGCGGEQEGRWMKSRMTRTGNLLTFGPDVGFDLGPGSLVDCCRKASAELDLLLEGLGLFSCC